MLNELTPLIDTVDTEINYWFIRTDGGKYFDTFLRNNFIGINWNSITLADLNRAEAEIKSKIARTENIELSNRKNLSKITDIHNKLKRFQELQSDDVVVIPSENSASLAFGIILDDAPYMTDPNHLECSYTKRRRVKWLANKPMGELDNAFYKIKRSRHSISSIKKYADYIDSVMYSVYRKADNSHFVVNVLSNDNINWKLLADALLEMHTLMQDINNDFSLNEDIQDVSIKISLNSPGLFNLKQKGISLLLMAAVLGSQGCSDAVGKLPQNQQNQIDTIQNNRGPQIDSVLTKLNSMGVNL